MKPVALVIIVLGLLAISCATLPSTTPTFNVEEAIQQTFAAFPTYTPYPTPEPSSTPTLTLVPTMTSTSTLITGESVSSSDCLPPDAHTDLGVVTGVIDGEVIEALINGQSYAIRFIGLDAPEQAKKGETDNGLWEKAKNFNTTLVENQIITLVKDVSETDKEGRLLRYVFVGDISGVFVNYEILRQGYAHAYSFPPDLACAQVLIQAEQLARHDILGIWVSSATPGTSTLFVTQSPNPSITNTPNCNPSYPSLCIPPPPPDLSCDDIPYRDFPVYTPDPHGFDEDNDGIGCESSEGF